MSGARVSIETADNEYIYWTDEEWIVHIEELQQLLVDAAESDFLRFSGTDDTKVFLIRRAALMEIEVREAS